MRATAIAPPEPGLTEADLVERARRLVPVLRERQEETERAGRILDETCRDFLDAGFYRILQPRCFGGYELDLAAFSRVAIELGRGCPSSAWTYALTAGHIHMLSALFSEEAQVDVYGEDGDVRMPGNLRLLGDAVPVEGGYRLTGAWDYLSGCDVATHLVLGARVAEQDGEPERRLMLIADAAPFEIVDNRDVLGLRGTGSRRVVAEDVFVPECRTMTSYYELDMRTAPGRRMHANPLYAGGGPTALIFGEITAVAVGAARGVLDLYEEQLRTRNTTVYPIQPMKDNPEYHRLYGEAVQLIEVAEAALLGSDHEYMERARRDVEEDIPFSRADELRMMLRKQYVCKLALDAVDLMLRTVGSRSMKSGATPALPARPDDARDAQHRAAGARGRRLRPALSLGLARRIERRVDADGDGMNVARLRLAPVGETMFPPRCPLLLARVGEPPGSPTPPPRVHRSEVDR